MNAAPVNVLLLGKNEGGWACIRRQLEKRGCPCWSARSPEEALVLSGRRKYDLILTSGPVGQAEPFLAELGGAHCNGFYCHPVEDGCWWLPFVRHGHKCFGAPGVRGGEFLAAIDQILHDRQSVSIEYSGAASPLAAHSRNRV